MSTKDLEGVLKKFSDFTQKPVKYLTLQSDLKDDIKNVVKSIYDYTKNEECSSKKCNKNVLPKLIVEDFDEEQIWQQIELQNSDRWDKLLTDVADCITDKEALKFPLTVIETRSDAVDKVNEEENVSNIDDDEMEENFEAEDEEIEAKRQDLKQKKRKPGKSSIVDDDFFKLNEMEQFLLKEERNEGRDIKKHGSDSDEDSIDMFEEGGDEEDLEEDGESKFMYSDFFGGADVDHDQSSDTKKESKSHKKMKLSENENESVSDDNDNPLKPKKKVRFLEESSSSDDDSSSKAENDKETKNELNSMKQSEFEQRQLRLKQQISKLENKSLSEAPWQLKGEVDASKRPQNSLLEEVVDFDLTSRPPPIITEQTTVTLEDIIRRRIKDKVWDDVVKKAKPIDDALVFRKPEILDHSKSKMSLAQIYESEYLKQKHGDEEDPKEPESHTEIRNAMSKLFAKLDALSHYHYTPKAAQAEVKIISNTPAINMEEVAPIATSDAALLAPEEVKKKQKGELVSKEERTATDKKRERRKKKQHQKEKGKLENKDTNKYKKATEVSEGKTKSLKTSKAFFQHLNEDVNSLLKSGKFVKRKNVTNKGQ